MGDRLGTGAPLSAAPILLAAPLAGWSTPLEEVPDEVFAARMLGDGVAIDPTADTLHAPCDAQLVVVAAARHALTLRTAQGRSCCTLDWIPWHLRVRGSSCWSDPMRR